MMTFASNFLLMMYIYKRRIKLFCTIIFDTCGWFFYIPLINILLRSINDHHWEDVDDVNKEGNDDSLIA